MDYSKRMRELRENKKVTQTEVCTAIGIKRSLYNQYEHQYDIAPVKRLNDICNYFNVSFDYMLGLTNCKNYKNNNQNYDLSISCNRLKEFRKENNLTQEKLAKDLNTTQAVIANYERGRNIIATPFLYDICKKYKISSDYLLGRIDEPKYIN